MSDRRRLGPLALGALGVVFGDIGTSPLYAVNQIFFSELGVERSPENVLGCVSLILWVLILIITVKYVLLVLSTDNDGEGGVFALYGLIHQRRTSRNLIGSQGVLWGLMLAAGLMFGDGMITPAISVLSAVEGLKTVTPALNPFVLPITLVVLSALFAAQARGTASLGSVFGVVVALWMGALVVIGGRHVIASPEILNAFNPMHAARFFMRAPWIDCMIALGGVMLTMTGGEALFADLGHFGRAPIRLSWFAIVFPALVVNYLGQGAYLLSSREVVGNNLFYSMVPMEWIIPTVVLATAATVVASQALISGAFSLVGQAVGLGLYPRLKVVHTHHAHVGQIFVPFINMVLYLGCVLLVLSFGSSSALAGAYGLAESVVMVSTSVAMAFVARFYWRWAAWRASLIFGGLVAVESAFVLANSQKFAAGGFVPVLVGLGVFVVMVSWRWGRKATAEAYDSVTTMTFRDLIRIKEGMTHFPERNAVLMVAKPVREDGTVPELLQLLWQRHGILARNIIFVEVVHKKVPYIHGERCAVGVLHRSASTGAIFSVTVQFGFMEDPNVEAVLESLAAHREIVLDGSPDKWVVHVSQEYLRPDRTLKGLERVRFRIFSLLRQISTPGYYYYGMGDRVQLSIEILPVRLS